MNGPSIPHLTPPHNWLASQTDSTSSRVSKQMILPKMRWRVLPTPMGRTPGDLSIAMRWLARRAFIIDQSTNKLANLRVRLTIESLRHWLWVPSRRRISCQCVELQPVGPALPLILWAMILIWAPVTSRSSNKGIEEGQRRVEEWGGRKRVF